jgi:hypothetical protein
MNHFDIDWRIRIPQAESRPSSIPTEYTVKDSVSIFACVAFRQRALRSTGAIAVVRERFDPTGQCLLALLRER